jgi:hypothetical protein
LLVYIDPNIAKVKNAITAYAKKNKINVDFLKSKIYNLNVETKGKNFEAYGTAGNHKFSIEGYIKEDALIATTLVISTS